MNGNLRPAATSTQGRLFAWLLAPHAVSLIAFFTALAIVLWTESNRTEPDRILGLIGAGSGVLALPATLFMLVVFPYRTASLREWWWIILHLVGLAAVAGGGILYMVFHLV